METNESQACRAMLTAMLKAIAELDDAPTPIPFGRYQYFQSLTPKQIDTEFLDTTGDKTADAYQHGYTAAAIEYRDKLATRAHIAFVPKK